MVGDKGLNCVACHLFDGKSAGGLQGLDLLASYDRLKPDWFVPFMLNPAKYRPGIVMPSYWGTGNRPTRKPSTGTPPLSCKPFGITCLMDKEPRCPLALEIREPTLRSRTDPAFIVVAVAWPVTGDFRRFSGRDSLCFQCGDGSPFGSLKGEFVSVGWGGQGAGNFNPRGRSVQLAQDLAFQPVSQKEKPWPALPKMTKENPVNPDPLYPKNLGYKFRGYSAR